MLRELAAAAGPLSIAELADRLGVHPNTARYHLDTLVAAGRVERAPAGRSGPGRPALRFRPAAGMDPGGPRRYRLLAEILLHALADTPDPTAAAVAAGRAWGRQLPPDGPGEPLARLLALLAEMGFAPERRDADGAAPIGLRHCPFLEVTASGLGVVCPVHLGLMQGALSNWSAPVTVDRLEPFAEPDLCLAHLAPAPLTGPAPR